MYWRKLRIVQGSCTKYICNKYKKKINEENVQGLNEKEEERKKHVFYSFSKCIKL